MLSLYALALVLPAWAILVTHFPDDIPFGGKPYPRPITALFCWLTLLTGITVQLGIMAKTQICKRARKAYLVSRGKVDDTTE